MRLSSLYNRAPDSHSIRADVERILREAELLREAREELEAEEKENVK
jgi:hypothetical protein